jgi:hypothetical protein
VGYDDLELAELLLRPTTVASYDAAELGRAAAVDVDRARLRRGVAVKTVGLGSKEVLTRLVLEMPGRSSGHLGLSTCWRSTDSATVASPLPIRPRLLDEQSRR